MLANYEKRIEREGFKLIAGVDEAGRGPLAGPVVASAVILKKFKFKAEVRDSKKLSARQREIAYEEILKKSIFSVGVISHKLIDRLNIRQATIMAMKRAVLNLSVLPDYLLVDGRVSIKLSLKSESIIKGDTKILSIACASIVAKVTRDRIMQKYHKSFPDYGFNKHKGYGTREHLRALKELGPCRIHRFSFKPLLTHK